MLLYANADINSRVASTLPIYYWGFASFILKGSNEKDSDGKVSKMGRFACLHNLIYMGLNVMMFHTEIGFY